MITNDQLVLRLILATVIGGIIGFEREVRSKSAGFRTMILICLGATLFTILSLVLGNTVTGHDRLASNIVVGIGFLGAGVIFKGETGVAGITTAATIWLTAALGIGIGCGYYIASILGCLFIMFTLILLGFIDPYIDRLNQVRNYSISFPYRQSEVHKYDDLIRKTGLKIKASKQRKSGNTIRGTWLAVGNEGTHRKLIDKLLNDPDISEFQY